jgi:hypothetical protein
MKVAVCLSGAIKHPEKSLESLKRIYPNDYLKVFIHTWKIKSNVDYHSDSFSGSSGLVDLNILSEYNADDILIENYNIKRKKFKFMYENLEFSFEGRADIGVMSMYYSIFKSNQLKRKYERKNKILFDKVIRMRFDSDFRDKDLILDENINEVQIPLGKDWAGVNDQFAIGPSKQMNIYSNLFNKIDKLQDGSYNPERFLRDYLSRNGVSTQRFEFQIYINGGDL